MSIGARYHNDKRALLAPAVWAGPAAWLVVALVLLAYGTPARDALGFARTAIAHGEWWRLVTGNFVHLGARHLFLDALGLGLWMLLCGTAVGWRGWCVRSLALASGVGLGLYFFVPGVVGYVGLSGMIYGLFVLDLGHDAVVDRDGFAILCVVVIAARVGWAIGSGTPAWERNFMGGEVISAAHLCGMATAVLYVGVALAYRWYRHRVLGSDFRFLGRNW